MKLIKFLITGILFGVVMAKSEALSWYRIQEMFRFQSFHMYGIIGTAVVLGILGVLFIKKNKIRDNEGNPILFHPKEKSVVRYLAGGTLFGLGWAAGPFMVTSKVTGFVTPLMVKSPAILYLLPATLVSEVLLKVIVGNFSMLNMSSLFR